MTTLFHLTNKIAVVTGGSRGLGREMVLAFAQAGADMVIASRKLEACEAVARCLSRRISGNGRTMIASPKPPMRSSAGWTFW